MNTKTLAALLLSAAAVSAFAGEAKLIPMAAPEGAPLTVSQAVQRLRATGTMTTHTAKVPHTLSARIRPNVIEYETADSAFIIPAAGNVQGSNGTFFRSDVTIGNFNGTAQNIGVGWLVQGKDNTNAPLTYFTVPAS